MQGTSGSYAINGTELQLPPTTGKWSDRNSLGIDGNAHPIYSAVRQFVLSWGLMSPSEVQQINNFYLSAGNTGTVVVDLPKWGNSTYSFYSYSGCTLNEPEVGEYFCGYITDVTLVVNKVRT